jgi:hypothetical protein
MAAPTPTPKLANQSSTTKDASVPPSPLRCFTGSVISGAIAIALYVLTSSIAQTFANKPIAPGKAFAVNIALAVRTLVVGASTLATAIFAVATLGLLALGIQQLIHQFKAPQTHEGGDR